MIINMSWKCFRPAVWSRAHVAPALLVYVDQHCDCTAIIPCHTHLSLLLSLLSVLLPSLWSLEFQMFAILDDAFCKSVVIFIVDCVIWACV